MGGSFNPVNIVTSPFKAAGRVFKHVAPVIAPIVGFGLGGPAGAALGGAAAGAMRGGFRGAVAGGLGAGLGGYAGNALGAWLGKGVGPTLGTFGLREGIGSSISAMANMYGGTIGGGLGAMYGSQAGQSFNPVIATASPPIVSVPTFEQLRQEAQMKTEEAMQQSGIADILNANLTRNLAKYKTIYNRERFVPIRDVVKKRKGRI